MSETRIKRACGETNVGQHTVWVTEKDMAKLERLLSSAKNRFPRDYQHIARLARELDGAEVIPTEEAPPNVVTMDCEARVENLDTGREAVYKLALPAEADISTGKISVLAPLGTALLGSCEGDVIEFHAPGGIRRLRVAAVSYQPETVGIEVRQEVHEHKPAGGPRPRKDCRRLGKVA